MTDAVRCLDCLRFSFESAGREWANKGVGCCADHIKALKFDPERSRLCGRHDPADSSVVAKRVDWVAKAKVRMAEADRYRRQHLIGNVERNRLDGLPASPVDGPVGPQSKGD